ncbi:MAG: hypothetical protein AAF203_08000, partial [Pseudomonadota bacterium]
WNCEQISKLSPQKVSPLSGLFSSPSHRVTLVRTQNTEQKQDLLKEYPSSFSLSRITEDLPKKLRSEIFLFFLLCLASATLLLFLFFRGSFYLALLPFIGSLAVILPVFAFSNHPLSLMNFVAGLILLGLTLDYGIFCTASILGLAGEKSPMTAIKLSVLTSVAGFLPLAFCKHPVLFDLGSTIGLGLLGAYIFTEIGLHRQAIDEESA